MTSKEGPEKAETALTNKQGNIFLGIGLTLSAYMATTAATMSFVCPVCVVSTPVLFGAGIHKKLIARRLRASIQK